MMKKIVLILILRSDRYNMKDECLRAHMDESTSWLKAQ
jgi:hypothetical protein